MEKPKELAGIIGGMGPLATVELLRLIVEETPAQRDQDHIPLLMVSNPKVPDRTQAILGQCCSPLPALVEAANTLKAMGATFLAMPCNTAHHYASEVQEASGLAFVNMIDEAAEEAGRLGLGRVGIMGTRGTIVTGLYQRALEARGITPSVPDDGAIEAMMSAIYHVKAGRLDLATRALSSALHSLSGPVDGIILGCTELPLIVDERSENAVYINTLRVLAKAIVRRSLAQ